MASFYVTLPSNSSPTVYSNNTLTNYRVKLPQPISLRGQWEWQKWYIRINGITSINSWNILTLVNGHQWWSKTIDPGFYEDTASQVVALATNYPGKTRRLRIELDENCQVRFQGGLAEIVGFKTTTTVSESLTIDNPLDMKHIHNLYVYCDIVQPHAVGHSKVAMLRVINVTGKFGDDVSSIFSNIYNHPNKQKYIDTIELDIKDNTGRNIPFVRVNVIVTLHFRLRRAPQFIWKIVFHHA